MPCLPPATLPVPGFRNLPRRPIVFDGECSLTRGDRMSFNKRNFRIQTAALVLFGAVAFAQAPPPPPILPPPELDRLVSRIALYPDSLLAQIMAGATYTDQIQPAAGWADQHAYLHGDALAGAINEDHLPWDPSVQALLPFPSVLDMMARDMAWTS